MTDFNNNIIEANKYLFNRYLINLNNYYNILAFGQDWCEHTYKHSTALYKIYEEMFLFIVDMYQKKDIKFYCHCILKTKFKNNYNLPKHMLKVTLPIRILPFNF